MPERSVVALLTVLAASATTFVAGCASEQPYRRSPEEVKIEEDRFNERWLGKSEDDVLVRYGSPKERLPLSSGNHVDSYHWENFVSTSSSGGAYGAYGGGHSAGSQSTTVYCDRRFEIDKTTLKVTRAVITGNNCDYNK